MLIIENWKIKDKLKWSENLPHRYDYFNFTVYSSNFLSMYICIDIIFSKLKYSVAMIFYNLLFYLITYRKHFLNS